MARRECDEPDRHAKKESSKTVDRSGTRTNAVLHKFAKVPWLKLRRDDTMLNSGWKIAALSTQPLAIEEIDSEEERQTRLNNKKKNKKKKKETLGMDESMEILKAHALSSSGAWSSTDQLPPPGVQFVPSGPGREKSIAQHSTPDIVLWSEELVGLLESAHEERKARGKSAPTGPNVAEKATHDLTHTSFRSWCSFCVRARAADDPHHRRPYKELDFPVIMADY